MRLFSLDLLGGADRPEHVLLEVDLLGAVLLGGRLGVALVGGTVVVSQVLLALACHLEDLLVLVEGVVADHVDLVHFTREAGVLQDEVVCHQLAGTPALGLVEVQTFLHEIDPSRGNFLLVASLQSTLDLLLQL